MSIEIEKTITKLGIASIELGELASSCALSNKNWDRLNRSIGHIKEVRELLESMQDEKDESDGICVADVIRKLAADGAPVKSAN